MVRPCVARSFVDLVFGLASMYPASDWSGSLLRATMDISARSISLPDRPRLGQTGHQCSIAPGRPVSISSLPLADLGGEGLRWPFLHPGLTLDMRRAQAGQGRPARAARRAWP